MHSTAIKISVALCTYNGARYLREQLASIKAQSRQPDELVVYDDRSTDDTFSILVEFSQSAGFPARIALNQDNIGIAANFSKAVGMCSGDVIALCDQDDVWNPNKLQRIEEAFSERPNVGMVFSNASLLSESGSVPYDLWQAAQFTPRQRRLIYAGAAFEALLHHNVVTGATCAFRGIFKEKILPVPPGWIHDYWIALIVSFYSDILPIDELLIRYRIHDLQAVGVAEPTFQSRVSASGNTGSSDYSDMAKMLNSALCNLVPTTKRQSRMLGLMRQRIAHLEGRSKPSPLFILKELANRRYFRFASGLWSAAKDMMAVLR